MVRVASSPRPKVITVIGPTASGKSDLAIALARTVNGEIISADSRQVYRGMDIGTGKVTKREQRLVRHHLLDVASPAVSYTVHHFQRDARKIIKDIIRRGKVPILCGGTGFWIEAVLSGTTLPEVKPDKALRKRLAKLSPSELYKRLQKLDPDRAKTIDRHNPVRLIRALEIVYATKKPVPPLRSASSYETLCLGITVPQQELFKKIDRRLEKRLRLGMVAEVQSLLKKIGARRLIELGLEYRFVTLYLQGKLTRSEMKVQLAQAIHTYAKRQMTWFRSMETRHPICWIRTKAEAIRLVKTFLK